MKKKINKIVFVSMSADVIHHGHVNIINEAKKFGDVIIGLISDEVISKKNLREYKRCN